MSYIETQVHAFAGRTRRSAGRPDSTNYMVAAARGVRPADLRAAATYFAGLEPIRHAKVIEAKIIPRASAEGFLYRFDKTATEPLGDRIVEGPIDFEQHRLRSPHEQTVAYVPVGSVARGAAIANRGTGSVTPCASCHGPHFVALAGESPSYIVRQLAGFRSRARNDRNASHMQAVASKLSNTQIVDLAAYLASRPPWTRAQMAVVMAQP